jgi:glycosyltransferase involved in cell wall biosynthesis
MSDREPMQVAIVGAYPEWPQRNHSLEQGFDRSVHRMECVQVPELLPREHQLDLVESGGRLAIPRLLLGLALENFLTMVVLAVNFRVLRRADVLYAPGGADYSVFAVSLVASVARRPVVYDPHNTPYFELRHGRELLVPGSPMSRLYWFLDRWSLVVADVTLAYSAAMADRFADLYGVDRAKLTVVYTNTNEGRFAQHLDADVDPGADPDVLYWGSFHSYHGPGVLLEAAVDAEWDLALAGEPLVGDVADVTDGIDPGRQRNVTYLGRVSDAELVELVRRANVVVGVLVQNPLSETATMNRYGESAYLGTPMVTARLPATEEVFACENGNAAVFCEPDSPADVRRTVRAVLDGEYDAVESRLPALYESTLSPEAMVEQFVSGVERAVG